MIGPVPGRHLVGGQDTGVEEQILGALGDGAEPLRQVLERREVRQGTIARQEVGGLLICQPGPAVGILRVDLGDDGVALGGVPGDQVFRDAMA